MTNLERTKTTAALKIFGIIDIVLSAIYMAISLSGIIILLIASQNSISNEFYCFTNAYNTGIIIFSFIPIVPIVFAVSIVFSIIAKSWSGVIKSLVLANVSTLGFLAYYVCLLFCGGYGY